MNHSKHVSPSAATAVANQIRQRLPALRSLEVAHRAFAEGHAQSPYLEANPLAALPRELVVTLQKELPDWLSPEEWSFEIELSSLCEQRHAVAFFHSRPVADPLLLPPANRRLDRETFQQLGWDRFLSLEQANRHLEAAFEVAEPLVDRLLAYRGFLAINPVFQQELQGLQQRWTAAIEELGRIPTWPVRPFPGRRMRRRGVDVTQQFVNDFNHFFDRWELQGLATWDLPAPRGGNVGGPPWPASVARPATAVEVHLPSIMSLAARPAIHSVLVDAQHAAAPAHLAGWLAVQRQEHASDLSFVSLRHMALIHYYRDVVLAGRYRSRFKGNVEKLDRAVGIFLGLSEDSVKKLRRRMATERSRPAR